MIGLEIATSRHGRLWPSEHWKCLIDSLFAKGSKDDPRLKYRDLPNLNHLVEEREGRFCPMSDLISSRFDDPHLQFVIIRRAPVGSVSAFETTTLPNSSNWPGIAVPWFGTIGDRKAEQQTRRNRQLISDQWPSEWSSSEFLSLEFVQSPDRLDRDLDNLADSLTPLFSARFQRLQTLRLFKTTSQTKGPEILRASTAEIPSAD